LKEKLKKCFEKPFDSWICTESEIATDTEIRLKEENRLLKITCRRLERSLHDAIKLIERIESRNNRIKGELK